MCAYEKASERGEMKTLLVAKFHSYQNVRYFVKRPITDEIALFIVELLTALYDLLG